MIEKEKKKKLYYTIAEVAEMFHVNQSTLRFWEKGFPQINLKTNDRGVRYYRQEDIELIGMIYFLVKEQGMKIANARQKLKNDRRLGKRYYDITTRLRHVRDELKAIKKELDSTQRNIQQENSIETNQIL